MSATDYAGPADVEIDCAERLILPGFVNIHTHPSSEPLRKGITDETRSPGFWHSSLYEYLTVFRNDLAGQKAATQVALAELLMSGVTTVVDLSFPFDGWLDTLAETGLRAVIAPMFRDARWYTSNGHELSYDWDLGAGRTGFREGAPAHRARRPASVRTPQRHGVPGADRHLLAGADPGRL